MTSSRRELLTAAAISAWSIAGCQGMLSRDQRDEPQQTTEPPTHTSTETVTQEQPRFSQEGTLYVEAATENGNGTTTIGPSGFFDGPQEYDPETQKDEGIHLTLEVQENGETTVLTTQEMRERYHFDQIYDIFRGDDLIGVNNPEVIREFPENLTDDQWVQENIIQPRAEEEGWDTIPTDELFQAETYTGNGNLQERIHQSGYDSLWRELTHLVLGGPDSNYDNIKSAALSAADHYSAGKDTYTFDMKTNTGYHGLGFAITGATYEESEMSGQETWIIETDPNEDSAIVDLDEHESYPNDSGRIMTETPEHNGSYGWKHLGMTQESPENVTINMQNPEQFDQYLNNPDNQKGMKYIDSACIAAHINEQAHEDGALPEFEDATIDVYPDRIEYELAS